MWTGITWPNDQSCDLVVSNLSGTTNVIALVLRASPTDHTWYQLALQVGSVPQIRKLVAGVSTIVSNCPAVTYANGDVWSFQVAGALFSIYQNNVLIHAFADLSITSGSPGFICFNPTGQALTTTQVSAWRGYSTMQQDGIWAKKGIAVMPISTDLGIGANCGTANACIIQEGNAQVLSGIVYKMWYASGQSLGYAESLDAVSWTRRSGYLISGVGWAPWVIKVGSTYHLYAQAGNASSPTVQHYTSSDGITWSSGTTVFSAGTAGQWDDTFLTYFTPVYIDGSGTWFALYCASRGISDAAGMGTGLATSPDGLTWTRYAGNPVIRNFFSVVRPVRIGNLWYAWGVARNPNQTGQNTAIDPGEGIRYQSADLITWTNPVHSVHHTQQYEGTNAQNGGCYSSFVIEVAGNSYMYGTASWNENITNPVYQIWLATTPVPLATLITQSENGLTQLSQDTLQRANENPLSDAGQWQAVSGQGALQLVSNKIEPATTSGCVMSRAGTFPANQFSTITLGTLLSGALAFPIVRINGANFYYADVGGTTGAAHTIKLHKFVSSVDTVLVTSSSTITVNAGDVWTLAITANVLQLFQNGFLVLQAQDNANSITSGAPGVGENTLGGAVGNALITAWAGGSVTNAPISLQNAPIQITITMRDGSTVVLPIPPYDTATEFIFQLQKSGGVWSGTPDPATPATWWPYRDWQKVVTS